MSGLDHALGDVVSFFECMLGGLPERVVPSQSA